jgi:hypothetical protein
MCATSRLDQVRCHPLPRRPPLPFVVSHQAQPSSPPPSLRHRSSHRLQAEILGSLAHRRRSGEPASPQTAGRGSPSIVGTAQALPGSTRKQRRQGRRGRVVLGEGRVGLASSLAGSNRSEAFFFLLSNSYLTRRATCFPIFI